MHTELNLPLQLATKNSSKGQSCFIKVLFAVQTMLSLGVLSMGSASAAVYVVDRYQDDQQSGSLRWAIQQANAEKITQGQAPHEIQIQAIGVAPFVIKLDRPLPAIKNPVKIVGQAWQSRGEFIAVDGSNYIRGDGAKACPGAIQGQYGTNVRTTTAPGFILQDVNGVTLTGLDIRSFCIGVLVNRSGLNLIQYNRISHNYGGAGVMLTGDDGKGNSTATTTNNNRILDNVFIDNGDGLEMTRGAAFNTVANNQFISTKANPEPSQGIEILWGNDNVVVGNLFENYSDGLQINWGKRNYIAYNELRHNSNGFNLTGDGNIIANNKVHSNRIGVAIRSEKDSNARITLSQNLIWNNAKDIKRCEAGGSCVPNSQTGAVVFSVPGLEHADYVGSRGGGVVIDAASQQKTCAATAQQSAQKLAQQNCNAIPNQNLQAPRLSLDKGQLVAAIKGQANAHYRVELFGNDQQASTEAQHYLGEASIQTNAQGTGHVSLKLSEFIASAVSVANVTATVTDAQGASSALSPAVVIK